jgi:hypothetical protein
MFSGRAFPTEARLKACVFSGFGPGAEACEGGTAMRDAGREGAKDWRWGWDLVGLVMMGGRKGGCASGDRVCASFCVAGAGMEEVSGDRVRLSTGTDVA